MKTAWCWLGWASLVAAAAVDGSAAELPARQIVREAQQRRPRDFWPRGSGHAILAIPGSSESLKGYHEPGGSFSPGVPSFGLAIWVCDSRGVPMETSDTLALGEVEQRWEWPRAGLPALATTTEFYRSRWSAAAAGVWVLQLESRADASIGLSLGLRSVGPAGGPVQSLEWKEPALTVNGRWTLTCQPPPRSVSLGLEGEAGWTTLTNASRAWRGASGWGFARLDLRTREPVRIEVRDGRAGPAPPMPITTSQARLNLSLPDPLFTECLHAQVNHLLMGLTGRETRAADPFSEFGPWPRSAALTLVGLVRSGQIDAARHLAAAIAEQDFFGANGPEADAPGWAIWALEELAGCLRQPAFDRWLAPHVMRKADLLGQMLRTPAPMFRPVTAPVRPSMVGSRELTQICDAARDGLISGKVDQHRPVLYVNATAYAGLVSASRFAERLGESDRALAMLQDADVLRQSWVQALDSPGRDNDRTTLAGWWPSGVAAASLTNYLAVLDGRWWRAWDDQNQLRITTVRLDHLLAEAHQWLWAGSADRAWTLLSWCWQNQASPGLFSWGHTPDPSTEKESWTRVRGWIDPPHLTPDYRVAAELLLLQLDMLAYLDESGAVPVLVVGAGVPRSWTRSPMHARGLITRAGLVDWSWQPGHLTVAMRGWRVPVRVGPEFPPETVLHIQ
ncbi:MAG: hypothetical protein KA118_19160 [Verrucomicrobia bacterium]|nr:hypothetical protein [Verrucomicrobiota bacterium]